MSDKIEITNEQARAMIHLIGSLRPDNVIGGSCEIRELRNYLNIRIKDIVKYNIRVFATSKSKFHAPMDVTSLLTKNQASRLGEIIESQLIVFDKENQK